MKLPDRLFPLYSALRQSADEQDARIIIARHTGYEWADIIARGEEKIPAEALSGIGADVKRRMAGEPVSRIYGSRGFWGLEFRICADTLDPRPDTETLISAALKLFERDNPLEILDLGTGSGCILVALLHEYKQARGVGIDKSLGAVKTAIYNAAYNNVSERAQFFCGSWANALEKSFDLIVSNPPYIANPSIAILPKEVQNHDPIQALDGGKDGLNAYRDILTGINSHLKLGGIMLFEIGYDQQEDVTRLAEESGFFVRGVHRDLAGMPRVVEISGGDK